MLDGVQLAKALGNFELPADVKLQPNKCYYRAGGVVGIHNLVELEMMRNQPLGIDPVRLHSLEQQGRGDGVDEPGRGLVNVRSTPESAHSRAT